MIDRAHGRVANRNPFEFTDAAEVERAFAGLGSLDPAEWAAASGAVATEHAERARAAEGRGDPATAKTEWLAAYNFERVARYPAPSSPAKAAAYARERAHYANAARFFDPPVEIVRIPFRGRPGEGAEVVAHLRVPRGRARPPLVMHWGGIDSYKEDRRVEPYLERGLAVLALDMPGAGEAPLRGSLDAERLWDPVFDWAVGRGDVDGTRVAIVGGSTGGYWATKLAHTHRERIRAAVNHGGPVHEAFTERWIERSQRGDYPFELVETLAWAFGLGGPQEYVAFARRLFLLAQGLLDRPCGARPGEGGARRCARRHRGGRADRARARRRRRESEGRHTTGAGEAPRAHPAPEAQRLLRRVELPRARRGRYERSRRERAEGAPAAPVVLQQEPEHRRRA